MNTPEDIISAFEAASERLLQFRMARRRQHDPSEPFIVEAHIRLKQAEYFLKKFRELDLQQASDDDFVHATAGGGLGTQIHDVGDVIKAHGEAFYYFAFRARDALAAIPGVDLRFEAIGVRNVRNHMVEHPDKGPGVMVSWWMYDCPEGLVLAPGSEVGQAKFKDAGLYPNAQEFIQKLTTKLDRLERA